MTTYLQIPDGEGDKYWNDFRTYSYAGVKWKDMGDLNLLPTIDTMRALHNKKYHNKKGPTTREINFMQAMRNMKEGDIVVVISVSKNCIRGIGRAVKGCDGKIYHHSDFEPYQRVHLDWIYLGDNPNPKPKKYARAGWRFIKDENEYDTYYLSQYENK